MVWSTIAPDDRCHPSEIQALVSDALSPWHLLKAGHRSRLVGHCLETPPFPPGRITRKPYKWPDARRNSPGPHHFSEMPTLRPSGWSTRQNKPVDPAYSRNLVQSDSSFEIESCRAASASHCCSRRRGGRLSKMARRVEYAFSSG